ncbi:MAG: hypothetical protein COA33_011025 [Fluviicola sp.]|nr:hypothetical protein [Fluviicola sp.]
MLILTPVMLFVPEDGWDLGFTKVKFLSQEDYLHPKEQENTDITEIIADIDTTMVATDIDSLIQHQNASNGDLGEPDGGAVDEDASTDLQMDASGRENLNNFFVKLANVASKRGKISMQHYGDSQLEGDRMTSYIRQKIQTQFGGNGPGLIPATNVYNTFTFKQTFSENFKRYTAFGGSKLENRKYGAMASASRFTPEYTLDSLFTLDSLTEQTGWIEFGPSRVAYSRAKVFNNVRMHYNSCVAPTLLRVYQDGAVIHEEQLNEDGGQHTVKLSFASTPSSLKYEFTGKVSPNICAFSLEGDYGVQVSNIAMRGSSGTVFNRINNGTLRTMFGETNTQLVIMQFGGNSVPFFKDSTGVTNYANWFKSQMRTVKNSMPGAMIVVIGPSDMSNLNDGIYETYKFLPFCVAEMKRVTLESGGAFWSLYAAMGGKNSMPSWVEKGLAGKDYIHFSNGGAKFASQMFYDAFIAEYAKWKSQNQ